MEIEFDLLLVTRLTGLFLPIILSLIIINVSPPGPAVTVNPPTPTAGVSFTLSGIIGSPASLTVYRNGECSGAFFFVRSIGPGPYTVYVPGQPAGSYSAEQSGSACVQISISAVASHST